MGVEQIWPLEGIEDLPVGDLAVASLRGLQSRWADATRTIMSPESLRTFNDRLHREWSIETGRIENLYDIEQGVTLTLIEQGFEAALMPPGSVNRDPETVLRLLKDQAAALEGLFAFVNQQRSLSMSFILELHQVMTASQETVTVVDASGRRCETELLKGQWKRQPNFPQRGGREFRYCPPEQVASEMDRLVAMHLTHTDVAPEVEAAWLHHRFTQIHPFQDGNGRIARALATLVLIRGGLFPMVVGLADKADYLACLEAADAGNLGALVMLIARGQQHRAGAALRFARGASGDSPTVQEAITAYATRLDLAGSN